MFRYITKYLTQTLYKNQSSHSRFPRYKQVLNGGFGQHNGGSYVLEMETFPFKEEDIRVRVSKNEILIEGKMEERLGDDFMMYVFTKRCHPPNEIDVTSIEYKFEGDRLFLTGRTNK